MRCADATHMDLIAASSEPRFRASVYVMERKWTNSHPFWHRLVEITGEENPGRIVYFTDLGYTQLTRYRSGKAGERGPSAADLEKAVNRLKETKGIELTIGQLWGTEPLGPESLESARSGASELRRTLEDQSQSTPEPPPRSGGAGRKGRLRRAGS